MSQNFWVTWGIAVSGLLFLASSCQDSGAYSPMAEDVPELEKLEDSTLFSQDKTAICVWPIVGLRQEPGRKEYTSNGETNYMVPIFYGEQVELLGKTDTVRSEDRVYMKIRLQDGKEGWVYTELFEENGVLAVVLDSAELYRRPDLMTLRDEALHPGEIIVLLERKDDWLHVSGNKKTKKGWTKVARKFAFDNEDLKIGLLLAKAEESASVDSQRSRLQEILANPELAQSELIELVKQRLAALDSATQE